MRIAFKIFAAALLLPAVCLAQSAQKACYEASGSKRLRQVVSVEDDGTIVLDGNERAFLAGVEFPEDKSNEMTTLSCLGEAVNYIRARIGQRSVFIIPAASGRDINYRLPAYVFESEGGFINLELIRYGFATAEKVRPGTTTAISCSKDFLEAQKGAKKKKIAGWKSGCLKGDAVAKPKKPKKDESELQIIDF